MPVFKVYTADLSVEIAHGGHIQVGICIIILAQSLQRVGHICNDRVISCRRSMVGYSVHGKIPGPVIVYIISIDPQNVHWLLFRAGNHGMGQIHLSVFFHLEHCLGGICLDQAMVHHIATHRHRNMISPGFRCLRRHISGSILFL